jgi:hypothetical protein
METIFIVCLSVGYLMYALLHTDVLYFYLRDNAIGDWLKMDLYEKESKNYFNYLEFIRTKNTKSFWANLLTCPICLSFWIGAIACEFSHWYLWLFYSFVILVAYGLLKFLLKE